MGSSVVYEVGAVVARKYRLLRQIGTGGMGAVWIARNETTHAEVALKTWRSDAGGPATNATPERFRHEARLAALVTHRSIVQVFDLLDEPDGSLALVMELLRGEPLDRCVARHGGSLSPVQAVALVLPILSALAHAHRLGVVHRDVKPGNVFLTVDPDGIVLPKLVDFGIAKAPAAGAAFTLEGDTLGTPRYMAPEQIRNEPDIDGRADVFAVGVMLVEMMTGTSPFLGSSSAATLAAVLERELDPSPSIPPALWVELGRALAKRPFERHATASELAESLRRALGATDAELTQALQSLEPQNELAALAADGPPTQLASEHLVLPLRRPRAGWIVTAGAALALAVAVAGSLVAMRRKSPATEASGATAAPASAASAANTAPPNATALPAPEPPVSAAPSVPALARPVPKAAPTRRPTAPAPTGGPKPVATTPGF